MKLIGEAALHSMYAGVGWLLREEKTSGNDEGLNRSYSRGDQG